MWGLPSRGWRTKKIDLILHFVINVSISRERRRAYHRPRLARWTSSLTSSPIWYRSSRHTIAHHDWTNAHIPPNFCNTKPAMATSTRSTPSDFFLWLFQCLSFYYLFMIRAIKVYELKFSGKHKNRKTNNWRVFCNAYKSNIFPGRKMKIWYGIFIW